LLLFPIPFALLLRAHRRSKIHTVFADPGQYEFLNCEQLAAQRTARFPLCRFSAVICGLHDVELSTA
jgi:hypothetical protein